jgi:hypothetical protein
MFSSNQSRGRYEPLEGSNGPAPPPYASPIAGLNGAEKSNASMAPRHEAPPSRMAVFASVSFYLVAALVVRLQQFLDHERVLTSSKMVMVNSASTYP